MARKAYAWRYAQAAFDIAREKNELDRWQSDLNKIAALAGDAKIMAVLESPKIHFEDKAKLLAKGLGDINPLALNLVYLLVSRGRVGMVADIADEYQRLLDSYRGIEQAEVTTPSPLMMGTGKDWRRAWRRWWARRWCSRRRLTPGCSVGLLPASGAGCWTAAPAASYWR